MKLGYISAMNLIFSVFQVSQIVHRSPTSSNDINHTKGIEPWFHRIPPMYLSLAPDWVDIFLLWWKLDGEKHVMEEK